MNPSDWYAQESALKELRNSAYALSIRNSLSIDDGKDDRAIAIEALKTAIEKIEADSRLFSDDDATIRPRIDAASVQYRALDSAVTNAKGIVDALKGGAKGIVDALKGGITGAGFGIGFALILAIAGYFLFLRASRA